LRFYRIGAEAQPRRYKNKTAEVLQIEAATGSRRAGGRFLLFEVVIEPLESCLACLGGHGVASVVNEKTTAGGIFQ